MMYPPPGRITQVLLLAMAVSAAAAQTALIRIDNTSHPGAPLQIGDRYSIRITASPNQPVSVRTVRAAHIDWSPVVGQTDSSGRWSADGEFRREDFGSWRAVWTVGVKLASTVMEYSVNAPCLKSGPAYQAQMGMLMVLTCDTADGQQQSFSSPSGNDAFRTPDGRLIAGREPTNLSPEEYHMEILQNLVTSSPNGVSAGVWGDDAAGMIRKFTGPNALNPVEVRNVLSIVREAFADPRRIPASARNPLETAKLLQTLSASTDQQDLKQQIAETLAWVEAR
jgi:hypothetical protein